MNTRCSLFGSLLPGLVLAGTLAVAPVQGEPVLCVDEAHHNVHTTTRGYPPFLELARAESFEVSALSGVWERTDLELCDVLLVVSPRGAGREATLAERGRPAFGLGEVEVAVAWIESGGGLLLVTDHAPIGGAAEPLASALGVTMSNAFTEDPERTDPELGGIVYGRGDGGLGPHPVTDGSSDADRIDRVVVYLGQSLGGPEGATSFLTLSPSATDRFLTMGDRQWSDPSAEDRLASAAGRSQGLAFSRGEGRVVVLGDAAMLTALGSASGLDTPSVDNRRLAVNLLRWLAGSP